MKILLIFAVAGLAAGCGSPSGGADAGPPEVPIQFQASCAGFTACGGEVEGNWTYAEGCVTDPFPALKTLCPTATYENLVVKAHGTLSLKGGSAARNVTLSGTGVLKVPASCAGSSCSSLEGNLTLAGVKASCAASGGGGDCRCDITAGRSIVETSTYTVSGSVLTTNGRTYDYCLSGDTLQHRETGSDPLEPGTYLLERS